MRLAHLLHVLIVQNLLHGYLHFAAAGSAVRDSEDAKRECTAFHKRTGRVIKLLESFSIILPVQNGWQAYDSL